MMLANGSHYRIDEMVEPTFNLRLIEAVKHSRCLYDSTDRQYRSTEFKIKVWNRLVQVLNFEGDARTLYSRWKQLRDKYGKEKRKAKYNNDHSSWQYYKHLAFLDPHMIDRSLAQSPTRKESHEVQLAVIDPSFAANLVEEVRTNPCLYDIRDPKYRHTECRTSAWNAVIARLSYPGDVNSIYKQWKKLRDRYVREKRRIRVQRDHGIHEESGWELYNSLAWMDPYLDDRAQHVKRKHDSDVMSDYDEMDAMGRSDSAMGYNVGISEKSGGGGRGNGGGDVLLDGDSAFAASAVSDLRTLPDHARALAKAQIEALLESGRWTIAGGEPY